MFISRVHDLALPRKELGKTDTEHCEITEGWPTILTTYITTTLLESLLMYRPFDMPGYIIKAPMSYTKISHTQLAVGTLLPLNLQ